MTIAEEIYAYNAGREPLQRYCMRIIISSSATANKKYVAGFANQYHLHVYLVFVKMKREPHNCATCPHTHTSHIIMYILSVLTIIQQGKTTSLCFLKQVATRFT